VACLLKQIKNMTKTIVITGASRGIGLAVAEIFAANGYNLIITSRNEMNLYKAMEELQLKYNHITVSAKAFDLSNKSEAIAFSTWSLSKSIPDILVNNSGIYKPGNISDEPDGALEEQIATNLYAAYHVTRGLLPAMIKNKSGHIFNISSIAGQKAYPGGGAYSVSKFALHGFSTNLREELKPHNIKVTTLFPGAVLTDSWGDFDNSNNRIMVKEDIAKMIFVTSQLSAGACVEQIVMRPHLGDL